MTQELDGHADAGKVAHTPGPWPWTYTGDRKRIVVGEGMVEGPNGYEVAEVYSDDCPRAVAEANARLIAAAPDLFFCANLLESLCAWLLHRFGPDTPEGKEAALRITKARAAIARATDTSNDQ